MSHYHARMPVLVLLLLFWSIGCTTHIVFDEDEYKVTAWDSLSEQEKASVVHDPGQAVVNPDDEYRDWRSEEPQKTIPAVSVRFNTIHDAMLGPIVVYIDRQSLEVLGQALRF